ncbi:hypothetical protein Trydic_g10285 [Trypoxylus dichotomus]
MATRTAAKTTPEMETTTTATATTTKTTATSEEQATTSGTLTRAKRRVARKIDTTEAIRLLQTALDEPTSDMECSDDNSTIGNTTDDAAADPDGFRPPSRRQQRT